MVLKPCLASCELMRKLWLIHACAMDTVLPRASYLFCASAEKCVFYYVKVVEMEWFCTVQLCGCFVILQLYLSHEILMYYLTMSTTVCRYIYIFFRCHIRIHKSSSKRSYLSCQECDTTLLDGYEDSYCSDCAPQDPSTSPPF